MPQARNQLFDSKVDDYKQQLLKENRVSIASGLSSSNRVKTVEGRGRNKMNQMMMPSTPQNLVGIAKFDDEVRRAACASHMIPAAGRLEESSEYGYTPQ